MTRYLLIVVICAATSSLLAQAFTGRVKDVRNGDPIPFASVYITNVQLGTIADSMGYFEITTLLPDHLEIKISAPLYESSIISVHNSSNYMEFTLEPHHIDFDDIVVSSPAGGLNSENAFRVDRLRLKDLNALQSSGLAEAISNINGVQEASFGSGISKPVIRGMQGVRVLTLVNGIRVENQQWGGDHTMAVNSLGIGVVEVIKGPSSLLYGADAFGGVLYLADEPYTEQNGFEIYTKSRYESVNAGAYNAIGMKLSKGKVRFNIHGLYSDYSDYQVPEGEYAFNTRYANRGIKTSIGISNKNWVSHLRYTLSKNVTGLPGHAHHEEEEQENEEEHNELLTDDQNRGLISPAIESLSHLISLENKIFMDQNEILIRLGYTRNNTLEFEETFDEASLNLNLSNSIYNFRYSKVLSEYWKLISGFQGMYQINRNSPDAEEQLIPDFDQSDNGVYSLASYRKNDWSVQFGARYDLRFLNVKTSFFGYSFAGEYGSPNVSAGFVRSKKGNTIRLNMASGFRAPHVSELFTYGEHEGAIRYEIGNDNLKSEQSLQVDLSYEIHREHLELVVNPYYNFLNNYIYLRDIDSVINDLPAFEYTQAPVASLYGIDLGVHYHPHFAHWLHAETSYSYIRGEDEFGNSFSLIPQARINSFLRFKFNMKSTFRVEELAIQHQYYFDQNKVDVFESPSEAYQLIHMGIDVLWDIKTPLRFGLGVKNLLNTEFINHLSRMKNVGLDSPGRNFYLSVKYGINGKLK